MKGRYWLFKSFLPSLNLDTDEIKYCLWQRQCTPEFGRAVIFGFVEFYKAKEKFIVRRILGDPGIRLRMGHTRHEGSYFHTLVELQRWDVIHGPWEIGRFETPKITIRGEPVSNKHVMLRYFGRIKKTLPYTELSSIKQQQIVAAGIFFVSIPPRDWPMEVHVFWGDDEPGKVRYIEEQWPDNVYWKTCTDTNWDNYRYEETVVLSGFYPLDFDPKDLIKFLGREPAVISSVYNKAQFVSKRVVILSAEHPRSWYSWTEEQEQLMRLITDIRHFDLAVEYSKRSTIH